VQGINLLQKLSVISAVGRKIFLKSDVERSGKSFKIVLPGLNALTTMRRALMLKPGVFLRERFGKRP
jgi:hypothetical protein